MTVYILVCDPPPELAVSLPTVAVHHVHHSLHHIHHHHVYHKHCSHKVTHCHWEEVDGGGGGGGGGYIIPSYYQRLDTIIPINVPMTSQATVPEPSTFVLFFVGFAILLLTRRIFRGIKNASSLERVTG